MKRLLSLLLCLPLFANDTGINSGAHGPSPLGEFVGDESVIRMVEESNFLLPSARDAISLKP